MNEIAEFTLSKYIKFSLFSVMICLLLIGSITTAINEGDYSIILYQVGSIAILTTNHAYLLSEEILQGNSPEFSLDFSSIYQYLLFYSDFLLSISIIFVCIKLLAKMYGNSFVSNQQNTFVNYFLAIITYLLIQSGLLIGIAGMYGMINSLQDIFKYLLLPFNSLVQTLQAVIHMISPISKNISNYTNYSLDNTDLPRLLR